jgi:signal transduction histidine kinase
LLSGLARVSLHVQSVFGIYGYNRHDSLIRVYKPTNNANSLPSRFVMNISATPSGEIWIGTADGMVRYRPATDDFEQLPITKKLPDRRVYAVFHTIHSDMWVTTNKEVGIIDATRQNLRILTSADGLQGEEFNRHAHFQTATGDIIIGGVNGLNIARPSVMRSNTHKITPTITGMSWGVKELSSYDRVVLPYSDSLVRISFSGMDLVAPEETKYKYMLEGFDEQWRYVVRTPECQYGSLRAGTYRFVVYCANADGQWSSMPATISITILPPWWDTWWFRLIVIISMGSVIYSGYRLRTYRLHKRNQELAHTVEEQTKELRMQHDQLLAVNEQTILSHRKLEQANEELRTLNRQIEDTNTALEQSNNAIALKNDIIEDMNAQLLEKNNTLQELLNFRARMLAIVSHDLKSPLTGMIMGIEMLALPSIKPKDHTRILSSLMESARRMNSMIINLLEQAQKLEAMQIVLTDFDLAEYVQEVVTDFNIVAHTKRQIIHYTYMQSCSVYADKEKVHQVLDNLLSNAVKYSYEGTEILVHVARYENMVELRVQDHGQGFSADDLKKVFQPYTKLSAKPTGGESSTGVGLSIVKEFVELQGGTIRVESPGKDLGATFIVMLPVSQA